MGKRFSVQNPDGSTSHYHEHYHDLNPVGHLFAIHKDGDGQVKGHHDLGFGTVTNVGVMAMANDAFWAAPSGAAINTLTLAKYMATGTGGTASAATDITLQTWDSVAAVAGAQSLVSAANSQAYRVVGTINYTGSLAIVEFGLHTGSGIGGITTGSPFTATSATGGTVTGTPLTASSSTVQGQQQNIVKAGTTTVYGLITSNTTSALVIPAWYKVADGTAGSTPGSTETYSIRPVLLDRLTFSAINVINGDSIQFTFTLTLPSGG